MWYISAIQGDKIHVVIFPSFWGTRNTWLFSPAFLRDNIHVVYFRHYWRHKVVYFPMF